MQTFKRMPTWQKVLLGGAIVGAGVLVYRSRKKTKPKAISEPEVEEPLPEPEPEPEPEGIGYPPESPPMPPPAPPLLKNTIARQVFNESDNNSLPAPVRGRIVDNNNGTYSVYFRAKDGNTLSFHHHTKEAAELRLDSTVKQPSEWQCVASYDTTFDGWVCKSGANPGDMVARGFHDTERGPAPWFVTWDGTQYIASFMPDLVSDAEELGRFDDLFTATHEAAGL